ncbi:MAG TPA: translation elongation factor Ts [Acidimicrobiales bacterium]|nr:translation elongation factor Ts [Acidimicrobiales bacterium]
MADFSAADVKRLRDMTGAGMMDAKRALTEAAGDFDAAAKWLRERGLGKAAERADREAAQGAVGAARAGTVAAIVELKCETDFVAKSQDFVDLAEELSQLVADKGTDAVAERAEAVDDLRITLKENITVGRVHRIEAAAGNGLGLYVHRQEGRGVNAVVVELSGGDDELARQVAQTAAFTKPSFVRRDEVPAAEVEAEREQLLKETQNEGKPEAAWDKIVEGKLGGWFKRYPGGVLLEQPFFVVDEKQSVQQGLGGADIVRFAQIVVGG